MRQCLSSDGNVASKFWITIGSIIFKMYCFDRAQTHALCVCACDSFALFTPFFVLCQCIRATLACYIFGAMTDKIYEQKKTFFLFCKTHTNFSLLCIECTSTHEIKTTKNVRVLSLLFPGICAIGLFGACDIFSRNILAVVFFHNHSER